MKPKTISLTLAAALCMPTILLGQADESSTPSKSDGEPLKMLLLDNDRVVAAHVQELPDGYLVSRNGGSVRYPKSRIVRIADTIEQLYEYKRSQVPEHDVAEHLRLYEWCLARGLRVQAKAELELVLKLDPENRLANKRMLQLQERDQSSGSRPAAMYSKEDRLADPSEVINRFVNGYGQESFSQYNSVERILVNRCASCHANPRHEGDFRLYSRQGGGSLGQRLTARNLEAVLSKIDLSAPQESELLAKAITAHGQMQVAAFGGIHDKLYQEIEDFVYMVAGKYNRDDTMVAEVRRRRAPTSVGGFGIDRPSTADLVSQSSLRPRPVMPVAPGDDVQRPGLGSFVADDAPPTQPGKMFPKQQVSKPRPVEDPFDPNAFNQQFGAAPPKQKPAEPTEPKPAPTKE